MRMLDYRRLGKQRVEAKQILNALSGVSGGWVNHPATRMWRGHERKLNYYMACAIREWIRRGYNNTMLIPNDSECERAVPDWLNDAFIRAHRSNLLRKDDQFYSKYNWNVPHDLEYIWPVQ